MPELSCTHALQLSLNDFGYMRSTVNLRSFYIEFTHDYTLHTAWNTPICLARVTIAPEMSK